MRHALLLSLTLAAAAPAALDEGSQPCEILLRVARDGYHGRGPVEIDRTLRLRPGKILGASPSFYGLVPVQYDDAFIDYTAAELPRVAATLSLGTGRSVDELVDLLGAQIHEGAGSISVTRLFPASIQERLGRAAQCDGPHCYGAALNFHEPADWDGMDFVRDIRSRYRHLRTGEPLRFGNMLLVFKLLRGDLTSASSRTTHAAIYLGGDFIFEKAGADSMYPYWISRFENMSHRYSLPDDDPSALAILAYDPAHALGESPLVANDSIIPLSTNVFEYLESLGIAKTIPAAQPRIQNPQEPCDCGSGMKYGRCCGKKK